MDVVPVLGSAGSFFFPIVLVILSLFNAFDIYKRILSAIGLK